MKTIAESRQEFNSVMQNYIALIIQREFRPFSDEFFIKNGLLLPQERVKYTPPPWTGVEHLNNFFAEYNYPVKTWKTREEIIPFIDSFGKYLICDDYISSGETIEVAMIALTTRGVRLENIWGISQQGSNDNYKNGNYENCEFPNLDKGIEWHNYKMRNLRLTVRLPLEEMGFVFPSLKLN